jgi:hypothetical protein
MHQGGEVRRRLVKLFKFSQIHLKKFVQLNQAVRVDVHLSKDLVHHGTRNAFPLTLHMREGKKDQMRRTNTQVNHLTTKSILNISQLQGVCVCVDLYKRHDKKTQGGEARSYCLGCIYYLLLKSLKPV